jgi:hypothetical protein
MPCFCYQRKAFCYLWTDKKTANPYILIAEGNQTGNTSPAMVKLLPNSASFNFKSTLID